jgi:hypothetical protein
MATPRLTARCLDHNFVAEVQSALDSLRALTPNWDGYGAPSIDSAVIEAAKTFVATLPENLVPRPRVVPMSNGTLQLEWHDGPKSLELEFESPTSIRYLQWFPEKGIEQESSFAATNVEAAFGLIQWFSTGGSE